MASGGNRDVPLPLPLGDCGTPGDHSIARLTRATRLGSATQGVLTAAALVSASLLLSRLLGLVRVGVFAGIYGTGAPFKEYNAAFRIPDILFTIVAGGALSSAFVPVFAGLLERRHEEEAWGVANTVLNSVLLTLLGLAGLAFILAPDLSRVLNPGFSPGQVTQTANLTRIMLVQPVLLGLGGMFAAMQNSYRRFLLPALAPLVYNLSIVLGAALLGPRFGVYAAAWAVVVGALLMFEIQIWGVAAESVRYRFGFNWRLPGARDVVRLMAPRLLGLSAFQIMQIVTFWLASSLNSTRNNAITYAFTLVMLPVGAVGTSLGLAVFPTLSRHAAVAQVREVERIVREGLRAVMFLALPATVGLILLRRPIVELLFGHGAWTAASTAATVYALAFYALAIPPLAAIEVCTRAFYAMKNTRTPVTIAVVAAATDVVLCIILFHAFGPLRAQGGLGLGTALAVWLQIVLLVLAIRGPLPGLIDRALARVLTAIALSTLVMGSSVYLGLWIVDQLIPGTGAGHALMETVITVAIGVVSYAFAAWALHVPEIKRFATLLARLRGGG